jgi:hypothetical protein
VLEEVEKGDVLLHRRDGHDVMLVRADRERDVRASLAMFAQLLGALDHGMLLGLADRLPEIMAWTQFLPDGDRGLFLEDLARVVVGAAELQTIAPVTQCLREWMTTASVHADPALREAIHAEHDLDELVERPIG